MSRVPLRRALPALALLAFLASGCGRGEDGRTNAVTHDTVAMVNIQDTARAAPARAAPAGPAQEPGPTLPPDAAVNGRPLLVVVYDPDDLELLNFGDVVRLAPVMGYVGRLEPAGGREEQGMPDPWENALEWAPDDQASAMVRDTAARLGITAGATYDVMGPDGPVTATVTEARPGRNECGRPGGIAVALHGNVTGLPPGPYYGVRNGASERRPANAVAPVNVPQVTPPADAPQALDTDGDGAADTFLGPALLLQRRDTATVYRAIDPSRGRC